MRTPIRFLSIALLLGATARPGSAQAGGARVGLTAEASAMTSSGGATVVVPDPAGDDRFELRQAATAGLALRADLDWSRWRAEFGLQVVPAELFAEFPDGGGIGLGGQEAAALELAPRLGYRLAGSAVGASLFVLAGPSIQFWSVTDLDGRVTLAIGAAFQAEAPLSPRLHLVARGGLTAGPSFFADEEPATGSFETTGVTRWQGGVGLRWLLRP